MVRMVYSGGVCRLADEWQASNTLVPEPHIEAELGWEKHFWNIVCSHIGPDIPRPGMVGRIPVWSGDLQMQGTKLRNGYMIVSNFSGHHIVVHETDVKKPTEAQYNKFFKKAVEEKRYLISQTKNLLNRRVVKNWKTFINEKEKSNG